MSPVASVTRSHVAAAPVSLLRRDATASAETSQAMLLTVLGEFVLPHGGVAWTRTLLELLELLDVREQSARQTLARMHARGWLDRDRQGRNTRWVLTPQVKQVLQPGAKRIYEFGQTARPWNHSWLVVLASVPERDRGARYRMAQSLSWAGLGSLGQGTWLSPWVDDEHTVAEVIRRLGIDATIFNARLGELGSPQALAAAAWDLPALRDGYDSFIAETGDLVGPAPVGPAAATALTLLVHQWRRFPFLDPDLPSELLPDDWPGAAAAHRFAELRARLLPEAQRWWQAREVLVRP